ncbi:MAG: hypothetical protein KBT45_04575 [Bacteroidales bacterium]|nr:hypothetical protein [Candidatus Colimorpha pelethequi]
MRKYFIALLSLTLVLVIASFVLMWCKSPFYVAIAPLIPLYFGIITGLGHYFVVKSAFKAPRAFVKNFLSVTVGTLVLHMIVMTVYIFSHLHTATSFLTLFCIGYIVYLLFETSALMLFVKRQKKQNDGNE